MEMVNWMIPNGLSNIIGIVISVLLGGVWYFLSQKQYHYALWLAVLAFILLLFVIAANTHNWITSKEMQQAQLPEISVSIFPIVDQDIRFADSTPHKYPFDEYTLLIFNKNKKSATVYDLTVEFFSLCYL